MDKISKNSRESIEMALNGNLADSDFERDNTSFTEPEDELYSLNVDVEELENKLIAKIDSNKKAIVFEFVWFNFTGYAGPTTDEVTQELQIISEVEDEIADMIKNTPYDFASGSLNPDAGNPSGEYRVFEPSDHFTPSHLFEGETIIYSLGLAHEETDTPF